MGSLFVIIPWTLFGVMVLFGILFAVIAWSATRRAQRAVDEAETAQAALTQMESRAKSAEGRIQAAEQRAQLAEQRIDHAEERMNKAREVAKRAERRAEEAAQRADGAVADARRADAQLQQRRDHAAEQQRKATERARSLLKWAREQWESRRESDRQKAQQVQGAFQQQLDAYLGYRRVPIAFRVDGEVDRIAAPMISGYAEPGWSVDLDGDLVRVTFPVDASLGFRA